MLLRIDEYGSQREEKEDVTREHDFDMRYVPLPFPSRVHDSFFLRSDTKTSAVNDGDESVCVVLVAVFTSALGYKWGGCRVALAWHPPTRWAKPCRKAAIALLRSLAKTA